MTRPFRYASVFAGIGGFDFAFDNEGMECVAQVEWDTHRQKVLERHWPGLLKGDDVADTTGPNLGAPDLIVGGFPCQDTSIAAPHRSGLAGKRSSNFYEFTRLLEEVARLVDSTKPRWCVIENPVGLLKSNDGRDMSAVVGELEELGYGWAYRTVDSRYLGSPQRRERVLIVGHRGGDPRPAWEVLGDNGASGQTPRTHQVTRKRGPKAVADPVGPQGLLIYRKSARPRKAISKGGYETWVNEDYANTLTGFDGGAATRQTHLVVQNGRLRTFTLTEWERLQGFPDDWTAGLPDSARYNALGDAMNVPMATWLARRLLAVDHALPMIGTP